jgi:Tfp pilus assembly protein PilF
VYNLLYIDAFAVENGMKKYVVLIGWLAVLTLLAGGCSRSIEDKLIQAEKYLKTGEFARAEKNIEEIILADSTSPEAIYGQALIDEYHGFEWEAIIKYIDASSMRNGYLPAMEAFIRVALKLDYLENARKMTGLYLKRQQESPIGYYYLADIEIRENRLDSARANIAKAATLIDDKLDIILREAEIDFHSGDIERIKAALGRLSQERFKTAGQLGRLASLYHWLNMPDSALYYARRALDEDSDDLNHRMRLAQYLYDEMRLEEAHRVIAFIIEDAEHYGPAMILDARTKWALTEENQAEISFFEFMKLDNSIPIVFDKHGDFYNSFHNTQMAAIEWQAAYTLAVNLMYPDDYLRQVYLKMVNGFLDERDIGMGVDYFEEGKLLLPNSPEIYFIEAELKSNFEASADSADMMVDDRIGKYKNDIKWLELAGRYSSRRYRPDQAIDIYTRLLEITAPKLEYFEQLFKIHRDKKDIEAIDALVENLPFRFRNSRRLQELLQDIYAEAGQTDKAIHYAELLYQHSREFMPYILILSDLYSTRNRKDEARMLLSTYRDDFPEKPLGYYRSARFDFNNDVYDSVIYLAEKSLAIDSGYAWAHELKGQYFQKAGNMDSALFYYEEAVSRNWPTPVAYHNLAEYLLQKNDNLDRAAGLAMAAVSRFGLDRRGYLLLGKIYLTQKKYKMARLQLFKGCRIFPDDSEYHFLLGKTYVMLDRNEEASESLNKALDLGLPPPQKEEAEKLLTEI